MLKEVLFDMDGVLIDSEYYTAGAAIHFFANKGYVVTHENFCPFHGTGGKGFFMGVAEKYGIPFNLDVDKIEIYNLYKGTAISKAKPIPGVFNFINLCKSKGLLIAFATSAVSYKMNINLEILNLQHGVFDALVRGEEITNNKPHPEIFQKTADKLGLQPNECLAVEDTQVVLQQRSRQDVYALPFLQLLDLTNSLVPI